MLPVLRFTRRRQLRPHGSGARRFGAARPAYREHPALDRARRRYANISIIEGNGASQYGIGVVSARIAEIVLRDEQAVVPIGIYNPHYGVTLSLPAVVGRQGAVRILEPAMSADERRALVRSADTLRSTLETTGNPSTAGRRVVRGRSGLGP